MSISNRIKKFTAVSLLGLLATFSLTSLAYATILAELDVTYEVTGGLQAAIKNIDGSDMEDLSLAAGAVAYNSASAETATVELVHTDDVKETGYFVAANTSGTAAAWTLSIAPSTGGNDAVWDGPGDIAMDFNDAADGTDDAGDTDTVGGQLSILKIGETANIDALIGVTTGVAFVGGAFSGTTGSVTLMTGTSGTSAPGAWGLTDIKFSQVIPASQAGGEYSMDFTLSII